MQITLMLNLPDNLSIGSVVHVPQSNSDGGEILLGKVVGFIPAPITELDTPTQEVDVTAVNVALEDEAKNVTVPIAQVFSTMQECDAYVQANPQLFTTTPTQE